MGRLPSTLPQLLRDAGLTVVVVAGWETRSRPASTGGFEPVGWLNHHTGASAKGWDRAKELAYAKWMFLVGRSDLGPPLVQTALGRSGVVYLGAAGRANHAGVAKASGSVAGGDGNSLYGGTEWMLSGTEEIPAEMYEAGVTLNAVMTELVTKTSVQAISCHYQTSVTGKWDIGDPHGVSHNGARVLDVTKFRRDVDARRKALYHAHTPSPGPVAPPWVDLPKIPARGLVLPKGPSDHHPVVRDVWLDRSAKSHIRVGGWNVNHATTGEKAKPTLVKMKALGVSLLMLNEVKIHSGILSLLGDLGYEVNYNDPEFVIAWLPGAFTEVRERDLVLSEHNYWLSRNEALLTVLRHKATDKKIRAICEHPPAHVSRPNHPTFDHVLAVHKDIAHKNATLADSTSLSTILFRDSNIDPVKDRPVSEGTWSWAYEGWEYLRAPEPTDGNRHIDEFLAVRLRTRRPISAAVSAVVHTAVSRNH